MPATVVRLLRPTRQLSVSLPGLLTFLAPKCPLCCLGMLSVLGIHTALAATLLYPIGLCCVAGAAGWLAIEARRNRAWGPFFLYLPAAGLLMIGKHYFENSYLLLGAAVLLITAVGWSAWRSTRRTGSCACAAQAPRLPVR